MRLGVVGDLQATRPRDRSPPSKDVVSCRSRAAGAVSGRRSDRGGKIHAAVADVFVCGIAVGTIAEAVLLSYIGYWSNVVPRKFGRPATWRTRLTCPDRLNSREETRDTTRRAGVANTSQWRSEIRGAGRFHRQAVRKSARFRREERR